MLGEVIGRRKRDVEALVARLAPRPDVAASVRKLPARPVLVVSNSSLPEAPPAEMPLLPESGTEDPPRPRSDDPPALVLPAPPPQSPPVVVLAHDRYRIQFTVATETRDTLRQVQALLRREVPDGDLATIHVRALKLLLDDTARKKLAAANPRPRRGARHLRSRHKPAELVRAVWRRDGGRCAFVAKNGRRCAEEAFLEFHHVQPHALGGEMTEENLSLRCRAHNQYEAELVFGPLRDPKQLRRTRPGTSFGFATGCNGGIMERPLLDAASRLSDDDLLRRLTELVGEERQATAELTAHLAELERRKLDGSAAPGAAAQSPPVAALAPGECQIEFTMTAETVARLCRLQVLMRDQVPDGDLAAIIDLALTALFGNDPQTGD